MSRTDRPACDLVRRALHAVIASEAFARSERLRSFLSYIVECDLSGKAAHLKGYSIGIDVFGRPPGFDAGNDPLVRVQAGKLRKLLDLYYETEGASDPLRIRVPLGSYVPEYSFTAAQPAVTVDTASPPRAGQIREKPIRRRSWLPAPISSPLALFSLLPMFFLAPSVYPETTNAAIAQAQLVLSVENRFAPQTHALPSLYIQQCWPAGGECNAFARAVSNSASYYRTVHLTESRKPDALHPLSYAIRVENRADGRGIYARLIHEQSGATIYVRHFSREQLRSEAGIAFEAVNFAARTLSAGGVLYRHTMQTGAASRIMQCLAQTEPHPGASRVGQHITCTAHAPAALADVAALGEADTVTTR